MEGEHELTSNISEELNSPGSNDEDSGDGESTNTFTKKFDIKTEPKSEGYEDTNASFDSSCESDSGIAMQNADCIIKNETSDHKAVFVKTEPVTDNDDDSDDQQSNSFEYQVQNVNEFSDPNIQIKQEDGSSVEFKDDVNNSNRPFRCDQCGKYFKKKSSLKYHQKTHTGERPVKCTLCEKSFTKNSDLNRHMRIHTGYRPHKCDQCGKTFTQRSNLKSHERVHTGERPFRCYICGKNFNQKIILTEHLFTHSGDKPHKCHICEKSYFKKGDLVRHIRSHTGERPYKCTLCERAYIKSSDLRNHMRKHTGDKPYKCEFCGKRFAQKSNMTTHFRKHPGSELFQFEHLHDGSSYEITYDDNGFPIRVKTEGDSARTSAIVPNNDTENGEIGDVTVKKISFDDKSATIAEDEGAEQSFRIVLKDAIDTDEDDDEDSKRKATEKSKKVIDNTKHFDILQKGVFFDNDTEASIDKEQAGSNSEGNSLNKQNKLLAATNISTETSKIPMILQYEHPQPIQLAGINEPVLSLPLVSNIDIPATSTLQASSSQPDDGIDNTKPVSEFPITPSGRGRKTEKETPYRCHQCGKYFTQRSNLITHMKIHSGERPWECLVCGKTFIQKNNLQIHSVVHTGIKPVKCEECGKYFSQKSSLSAHRKIHQGLRPIKCQVCGKGFTKSSDLTRHMRVHTGQKPFKCDKCDKRFAQRSNMVLHYNTHLSVKPFPCELCDKRFMQKLNLKLHMRKVHSGNNFPDKAHKCEICDSSFDEGSELEAHVQEHLSQFDLNVSID